jgi:hypothetical protein
MDCRFGFFTGGIYYLDPNMFGSSIRPKNIMMMRGASQGRLYFGEYLSTYEFLEKS